MHYITLRLAEEERGTKEGGLTNQEYHLSHAKQLELKQSILTKADPVFLEQCVIEVANF